MSATGQMKNILDAVWRRKWWVLVPPILGLGVSAVLLQRLPKIYRASTTVLVVSQRLPESYVRTTVTSGLQERLASLKVQILGPSYLDRVIRELKLVPEEASEKEIETFRDLLASNIDVPDAGGRNASFFRISVTDKDPRLAANVANMLADMFIDQNGRLRTEQAASTSKQLKAWLDSKKTALDALEERFAAYRKAYYGELPDQQGTSLQLISVAQARVTQLSDNISLRQNRIEFLRSQLQTVDSITTAAGLPQADLDPNLRRLQQLEGELSQLRLSYTDQNPDVRKKVAEIAEFRKLHPEFDVAAVAAGPDGSPAVGGVQGEIRRLEVEIAGFERERAQANRQIDDLTARVRNTPLREQELLPITRDRDSLRLEYQDLQRKYDEAARAEDLEGANQAEHFRVQDRARVPRVPYSPNPGQMLGMGVLIGLAVGAGLAFAFEQFDQTVRSEEAFKSAFPDLPLLVSIPNLDMALVPPKGRGKGKRRRSAAAMVAAAAALLSALGRFL